MKNYHIYILYILVIVLFGTVSYCNRSESEDLIPNFAATENPDNNLKVDDASTINRVRLFALPEDLEFAGEPVPLEQADVVERFEREIYVNAYWESNMLLMMKRAGRYLPIIEEILAKNRIHEDFKYVALVESGLLNVTSSAGAKGFWQFMESTAKEYGLEVNNQVDERYHLEKSTQAACQYIRKAYSKFGKWTDVAASFNMGVSGLSRNMDRQHVSDYYDLLLNDETSRYVFRILAFKTIFENPDYFGFHLEDKDRYNMPDRRELVVRKSIDDLAEWAIKHQSNYKILKIHNPWLRTNSLTISKGNAYTIRLPH